ncbi:DNA sulfur modification protein DndB [Bacillus safensis]|uniref:DNA sulfur modification protein DndB n=1 Tax=Bacillus safensis TaxID=561879 RepID=UPI000427F0EF|nr:DNA sulfur modification protein DndB [Bacillus safensis]
MNKLVIFDNEKDALLNETIEMLLQKNKHDKQFRERLQNALSHKGVSPGETMNLIIRFGRQEALQKEEKYLLASGIYEVTKDEKINPINYFPERIIQEIETTWEGFSQNNDSELNFPIKFEDVTKVDDNNYTFLLKRSEIAKMYENHLLQYNPRTQRTSETKNFEFLGGEIPIPELNQNAVEEISQKTIYGTLISSTLILNARFGSSSEGIEVVYDPHERTLTVMSGTLLDVIDGYHRIVGISKAVRSGSFDDKFMKIDFYNVTQKVARQLFGQHNTMTPVRLSKLKEMNEENPVNKVVTHIRDNSVIGQRISLDIDVITTHSDYLYSLNDVANAVEATKFPKLLKDQIAVRKIGVYLVEFFDEVTEFYYEEFLGDKFEQAQKTIVINKNILVGLMEIAYYMYTSGISAKMAQQIIIKKGFNFNRNNPELTKYKILNKKNEVTHSKNHILKYVKDKLNEVEGV